MLSVVLPVYNGEKFLRDTFHSVLSQENIDIEVVVIDDGSVDDSINLCREFEETDARVRVYSQKNAGVSATRNLGISLARGEYIAFLDQDDIYLDGVLSKAMEILQKSKADFIKFARRDIVIDNGVETKVIEYNSFKECKINAENIGKNYIQLRNNMMFSSIWNGIYKKAFLIHNGIVFDGSMIGGCEDQYFNLQLIAAKFNAVYISDIGYQHYIRKGISTSTKFSCSMIESFSTVCKLEMEQYRSMGLPAADRDSVAYEYVWRMIATLSRYPGKGIIRYSIQKFENLYEACALNTKEVHPIVRNGIIVNMINMLFRYKHFTLLGVCTFILRIGRRCAVRWK